MQRRHEGNTDIRSGFALLWLLWALLCLAPAAHAQTGAPALIDASTSAGPLRPALWTLRDPEAALDIRQLLQATGGDPSRWPGWKPVQQVKIGRYAEEPYWFYFRIANSSDRALDRVLDFHHPRLSQWQVHVIQRGALRESFLLGSDVPRARHPIPYLNLAVPLHLPAHSELLVVMSSRNYSHYMPKVLQVVSWQELMADAVSAERSHIGYFGVMFAALVYNLMVWGATRNRAALLLAASGAWSCGLMAMFLGYLFLWLDTTTFAQLNIFMLLGAGIMCLPVLFAVEFMQLGQQRPGLQRRLIKIMAFFILVAIGVRAMATTFEVMAVMWVLFVCIPLIGCIITGIWQLLRGNPAAPVYLLSGLPLIAAQVGYLGGRIGVTPAFSEEWIGAGQVLQMFVLSWALTHRVGRLRQDELRAQAESRAKSDFMAKMSHEIRNPMNAVLGMSELLRHSGLNERQARYNEIIHASGSVLLTLLNDILDYARLEARKLELEHIPFDLHALALQTLSMFKGQAEQKQLELICDIAPGLPRQWQGDPTRLRQIMLNLLSNAVKFSPAGAITLSLGRTDNGLRLGVADSGPGLSEEQLAGLFEAFKQGSTEVARTHGGSGLGLSICRSLADLMGGSIRVESSPGAGATFWLDAPLQPMTTGGAEPPPSGLRGVRLLVVDTSDPLCDFIRRHGRHWGMEVCTTATGGDALKALGSAHHAGRPFQLICMDFAQGEALVRYLREAPGAGAVPMLALARASALPDARTAEALGLAGSLEKPVTPEELREAFIRALDLPHPALAESAEHLGAVPAEQSLRVLVAEDNPVNQQVISGLLKRMGHRVTLAGNGAEALARVQQGQFDLLLMDCDMPELDGWQATRAIRDWERANGRRPVCIVAVTGHGLPEHRQQCLDAGMQEQLLKPISLAALQPVLEACIRDRQR